MTNGEFVQASDDDKCSPPDNPFNVRQKVLAIIVLFLATLGAGVLISGVVTEREARQAEVLAEFRKSWGPEQLVRSPVLVIPYKVASDQRRFIKIAPANLKVTARLSPEDRKRGMFRATVYSAIVEMEGEFVIPADAQLEELKNKTADRSLPSYAPRGTLSLIEPNLTGSGGAAKEAKPGKTLRAEGFLMLEATELSEANAAESRVVWNGEEAPLQNCADVFSSEGECQRGGAIVAATGLSEAPPGEMKIQFKAQLALRGTSGFQLVFQGKKLEAAISSPWTGPSFTGNILPAASTVGPDGFQAHWKAAAYSTFQVWTALRLSESATPGATTIGVNLVEATPTYRMINRASKYSILFVVMAFSAYALFELLAKARIHPVQYGLLGASLTLFTLLLVSLSEPLGYERGYVVSAGLVMLQASFYTATVARRWSHTFLFSVMLASLFGFLYVLLSLETFSLLVGSLGLFVGLSVVMALTRNIDWSSSPSVSEASS